MADDVSAHPQDVSPVTQDYLKAIWCATEWGGPPATVSSLADRFGSARPTVSVNLTRMAANGLLMHERYGKIQLTAAGASLAVSMVRRHRLLECFLVDQLGYSLVQVHEEAEALEHAVSDLFVDRLDDLLGAPSVDPHGDPIPDRDGVANYPAAATDLSCAASGTYRVERVSDADGPRLNSLTRAGIRPRAVIELDGRPGDTVRVIRSDNRRHELDAAEQCAVVVCPAT